MKRTTLLRKKPLLAKTPLKRAKPLVSRSRLEVKSTLARTTLLRKTPLNAKRRRARKGDDVKYLNWVRSLFCLVGGPKKKGCRGRIDPHHMTGGHGDQKRGKGATAKDRDALPVCRGHHDEFHAMRGFCRAWSKEGRRVWQEEEVLQLNKTYEALQLLEVA